MSEQSPRHLLHVKRRRYSEEYQRFYLRDIQALVLARTNTGLAVNILLGTLGTLILLIGFASGLKGLFIASPFALAFFIAWGVNAAVGPTCACYLRTAVVTEELPSLGRLRTARRALLLLKGPIEEAQGGSASEMPVEEESGRPPVEETIRPQFSASVPQEAAPPGDAVDLPPLRPAFHLALYALILLDAPLAAWSIYRADGLPGVVFPIWVLLLACSVIGALIRQHRMATPTNLKALTWGAFGYIGLCVIFTQLLSEFARGMQMGMGDEVPFDTPQRVFVDGFNYFSIIVDLLVGASGLLLIRDLRRANPGEPPEHRSTAYRPRESDQS